MRVAPFALAASLLLSGVLYASDVTDGEALVKQNDCLSCHQPTHKVVGPAYIDVAKKYKGDAGAVARLVKKVKAGGAGNWGAVPMAAHPNVSDADLTKMVKWVLAGAPITVPVAVPTAIPAPSASSGQAPAAPAADAKPLKKHKRKPFVDADYKHADLSWATDADVLKLMKANDCFGCHQPINRLGDPDEKPWPSFAKIQAKDKGVPLAGLVAKIHDGEGKLKFGTVPHPVYDYLPAEAVQASVQFILDGKYVNDKDAPVAVDLSKMPAEEWMKTRSDCFTCHSVNAKIVGPAYKDVAKKYAGASDAQVKVLVAKVKAGGSGNWGTVPMAAHPSAPDEQLEKAVRWVLSQK